MALSLNGFQAQCLLNSRTLLWTVKDLDTEVHAMPYDYAKTYIQARDVVLSRLFSLGNYFRNNYMSGANHCKFNPQKDPPTPTCRLTLERVECHQPREGNGDKVYLHIGMDGLWQRDLPMRMMITGDVWQLDLQYDFADQVIIEAWREPGKKLWNDENNTPPPTIPAQPASSQVELLKDCHYSLHYTVMPLVNAAGRSNQLKRALILRKMKCIEVEDPWPQKQDECYLRVRVDGVYHYAPQRNMGKGDVWDLNLRYKFRERVEVELWDGSDINADDLLGEASIDGTIISNKVATFNNSGHYELEYSVAELNPPEMGLLYDIEDAVDSPPINPADPEAVKPWRAIHQRENPLIATGKLLICLSIEAALGGAEALKIIQCALDALDTLYKFKGQGNHFDGYIIRWDAVTSDFWTTRDEDGLVIPDRCLNFLTDTNGKYLYCTPFDHPDYVIQNNNENLMQQQMRWHFCKRYRHWEPSQDEIIGLMMGYDITYRLVGGSVPGIRQRLEAQVNNLGDYLAEHGYMLVRPAGGFTARGAANVLPAMEYPFGVTFRRITGDPYRARCGWRGAVEKAGMWSKISGPIYGASALDLLAKFTLTEQAVKGMLKSLLLPTGLSPIIDLLDFGDVARAFVIYMNGHLFDVKGTPQTDFLDEDVDSGERDSFMVAYLLSKQPILTRFRLYMTGCALGWGKYGNTFPRYLSVIAAPLDPLYKEQDWIVPEASVFRTECAVWLNSRKDKPDSDYGNEPYGDRIFELAAGVLLDKGQEWEDLLVSRLVEWTPNPDDPSQVHPRYNVTDDPLNYMCGVAMSWLYQKIKMAKNQSVANKDFPKLPDTKEIETLPMPSVPNDVLIAAGSTAAMNVNNQSQNGPKLNTLPLHAIQKDRHGWDLYIDKKLNAAPLFREDPPLKPAEPVIERVLPPRLDIRLTYDFDGENPLTNPEVEAQSLDFGRPRLGYTPSFTLHLFNRGSGSIVVQDRVIAGDFTPNTLSVPGGEIMLDQASPEAILGCGFTPDRAGFYQGSLIFKSDAPNINAPGHVDWVIQLKADVAGPQIEITPTRLDFGDVVVDAWTDNQMISLSNTGAYDAYFEIRQHYEDEEPAGQFSCSSLGTSSHLTPGGFDTLLVSYQPTQVGPAKATLLVDVHPPRLTFMKQTTRVSMVGRGIELLPQIRTAPKSLDFGTVAAHQEYRLELKFSNTGKGPLSITSIRVEPNDTPFYINYYPRTEYDPNDLPKVLDPGETLTVNMLFVPESAGYASHADLVVGSNDRKNSLLQVPLSGVTPGSWINISPEFIDFGTLKLPIAGHPPSRTARVICHGTGPLHITKIYVAPKTPVFSVHWTTSLPATLLPGEELPVQVEFSPSNPGVFSARLLTESDSILRDAQAGLNGKAK
jgi:hypothetical protein